jgi:PAS domain S-box-containing protein
VKADIKTTGIERSMEENDLIVSKTNLKGIITYSNDVFCNIADYNLDEVLNKPHNLLRHPNMPRCVFKLLWDTIKNGHEIFAYIVNRCKNGDHYWVLAHVTPSFDEKNNIVGYHSNRRKPSEKALKIIRSLYNELLHEENKHPTERAATEAGFDALQTILKKKGVSYEAFVLSL